MNSNLRHFIKNIFTLILLLICVLSLLFLGTRSVLLALIIILTFRVVLKSSVSLKLIFFITIFVILNFVNLYFDIAPALKDLRLLVFTAAFMPEWSWF